MSNDTTITVFPHDRADEANAYAAEIGGYVEDVPRDSLGLGGGYLAVKRDHAEGTRVTLWSGINIPDGATLTRRDDIVVGDVVISSHSGRRTVAKVDTRGTAPGTTYMSLDGTSERIGPEAYPGDSLIPVVEYRTPKFEEIDLSYLSDPSDPTPLTVDPNRETTAWERRALVTVETVDRLLGRDAAALVARIKNGMPGDVVEATGQLDALLTEIVGLTSATMATHVKDQAVSDSIAAKARDRVASIREKVTP